MKTVGKNIAEATNGYKYFIFTFDVLPNTIERTNVAIIRNNTMSIPFLDPANKGNT